MKTQLEPLRVERRLNSKDVELLVGRSRQSIWRWIKAGTFPKPAYIAGQRSWTESQIIEWQNGLQTFNERHVENINLLTEEIS